MSSPLEASDPLRAERRARELLQRVAASTAVAASFQEAAGATLDAVCAHTGWPVGHVLVRGEGGALCSARLWHLDDPERFASFRENSENSLFHDGVGLPGRVAEANRPQWISDVTHDENFPRARLAGDLQVRAAFAFPVCAHGRVAVIFEFFAAHAIPPDAPLLDVMATVGALVGGVIERTDAEAERNRSELRFRAVVETANDAIISVDSTGKVVFWNRGAERMFGWTGAEIGGSQLTRIMPERYRGPHRAGLERVGAGGDRHVIGRTIELHGLRRDGTEFPIELSLSFWSLDGAPTFTGIIRDTTQRKAAEEELRRIAERLEASERQATEASRAKSAFLANMSHELRTPLNAILGFVQLMRRDAGLSTDQGESLDVIMHSGEHLLTLINDVLSIAKIEAGLMSLSEVDFDLGRLVTSARDLLASRARARGLGLHVEPMTELPRVRGDESKLRQVLINLLGNGIKFTAAGGVTLRVGWEAGTGRFEVEDSGHGIEHGELERIFEPFVQGGAGAAAGEGTGLGLAICRNFVRAMGGDLQVRSVVGKGSCFAFAVALARAVETGGGAGERRVVGLAPGQAPIRVLVVDNDADNRLLLLRLLGAIGLRVRAAADGREAVAIFAEVRPEVVLMDMRMAGMDGYEATRALRALEAGGARCVVIALTASAFDHDRPAILAAGCDEIVSKPFREAVLFETIARLADVEFLTEERTTLESASGDGAIGLPARLAQVPPELRAELWRALAAGDDLASANAAARIALDHPAAGAEVVRMVRAFQLDELLVLLEGLSS